jgi:hypothetical protein
MKALEKVAVAPFWSIHVLDGRVEDVRSELNRDR